MMTDFSREMGFDPSFAPKWLDRLLKQNKFWVWEITKKNGESKIGRAERRKKR
jgi:hypothetical protein